MPKRGKITLSLGTIDEVTREILKTLNATDYASAKVEVLRSGASVKTGLVLGAAAQLDVDVYHAGNLKPTDVLYAIQGGIPVTASPLTVVTIPDDLTLELRNDGASITLSQDDPLVLKSGTVGHQVTLYKDNTSSQTLTNPINLGDQGLAEAWVDEYEVDTYISASGVTAEYRRGFKPQRHSVYHLKMFGAHPSLADNSPAINRALYFLADQGGGELEADEGIYQFATALNIRTSAARAITISGRGSNATIFQTSADVAGFVISQNNINDLVFRGLRLKNTGSPVTATSAGVYDGSTGGTTSRPRFIDVVVEGFYHGFRMADNTDRAIWARCGALSNKHTGFWPGKRGSLYGCEARLNGSTTSHHGLYNDDAWDDLHVVGGEFSQNAGSGIHGFCDTTVFKGIRITGAICRGNGTAAGAAPCAGILLSTTVGGGKIRDVVISGVVCADAPQSGTDPRLGIYLDDVADFELDGVCSGNGFDGVRLDNCEDGKLNLVTRANGVNTNYGKGLQLSNACVRLTGTVVAEGNGGSGVADGASCTDNNLFVMGKDNGAFDNPDNAGPDTSAQVKLSGLRWGLDGHFTNAGTTAVAKDNVRIEPAACASVRLGRLVHTGTPRGFKVRRGSNFTEAASISYNTRRMVEFYHDNAIAGLVAQAMTRDAALFGQTYVPGRVGSIVGLWVKSNAARAGGTLTAEVYKNGVATGLQAVLDGTNLLFHCAEQDEGTDTFIYSDELDIRITTDVGWLPITADIRAGVEVLL